MLEVQRSNGIYSCTDIYCKQGTFSSSIGENSSTTCQVCQAGKYSTMLGANASYFCMVGFIPLTSFLISCSDVRPEIMRI